jgi:hypothetical protein
MDRINVSENHLAVITLRMREGMIFKDQKDDFSIILKSFIILGQAQSACPNIIISKFLPLLVMSQQQSSSVYA